MMWLTGGSVQLIQGMHKNQQKEDLTMSEKMNDDSRHWTISWEEALEREMEYQKTVKNKFLSHSVDSSVVPSNSQSQEQLQKAHAIGQRRKVASESFPRPDRNIFECQMVQPQSINVNPSRKLCDGKPPFQHLQNGVFGKPPSKPFQNKKHLSQQSSDYQHPLHLKQLSSLQYAQEARLLPEFLKRSAPMKVEAVHGCSLCKVNCMTHLHLEMHHQGKKHKTNLEAVYGGKTYSGNEEIWCPECKIKCVNDFSWNQHLMGHKHLARVAKKAIEASYGTSPAIKTEKFALVKEPQNACYTEEQVIAKFQMGISDNNLTSLTVNKKKLWTNNWPNCI